MMKKLFPVLIAAALLCTCIIGIMFTGASAEGSVYYVRSEANPEQKIFSSVDAALAAAEGETWGEDSVLTVLIDDPGYTTESLVVDEYGVIFGQKTIWRGLGEQKSKLPIIIDVKDGNSFSFEVTAGISMACANDYTFRNLTLPVGDTSSSTRFYAGSGEVKFEFVDFGTKQLGAFFGDNFTKAAYIGWDALSEGEVVTSSLTFGEGTTYNCDPSLNDPKASANEGFLVVASGFPVATSALSGSTDEDILEKAKAVTFEDADLATAPDIRPCNTRVGVIIDTRSDIENPTGEDIEFGTLHGRLRNNTTTTGSPVDELFIEVRSGVVVGIVGDDSDSAEETFIGDIAVNIYGGNVTLGDPVVRVLRTCTNYGDVRINVGQRYGVKTKVNWIQSEFGSPNAVVKGDYSFRMSGGQVAYYYGAPVATGSILNELTGGTIDKFDGSRVNQTTTVRNVVKEHANVTSQFYGKKGSVSSTKVINEIGDKAVLKCDFYAIGGGNCDVVENYISGGTFNKVSYGGGLNATCGSVLNVISGNPVFKDIFVGGSFHGTVTGDVTNDVSGGSYSKAFYGGSYGEYKDTTSKTTATVTDSTGATFNEVTKATICTALYSPEIGGTIFNRLSGGHFSSSVFGGSRIGNVNKIVNTLTNVTFEGSFFGGGGGSFNNTTKVDRAQYNDDGSFKMSEDGSNVQTASVTLSSERVYLSEIASIENLIEIPFANSMKNFYLGGYYASVGSVKNTINSGTFNGYFAAGNYGGTLGSVFTTVNSGTFHGNDSTHFCYYGGSYSGTMTGSVVNEFNGGIFKKYSIAGCNTADIISSADFAIKNIITGGTFSNFWGGSSGSSANIDGDIINDVCGGVFDYYLNDGNYYYAAFNGGSRNANHLSGDIINTIYGGTFYHKFYGGSYTGSSEYARDFSGTVTTRLVGGDIYAAVSASSSQGSYIKADLILDPDYESAYSKDPLCIHSTVGLESNWIIENNLESTTTVILDSTKEHPVYLSSSAKIHADLSNSGWISNLGRWEEGVTYLVMPSGIDPATVHTASVEADGGWIKTVSADGLISWVGCNGYKGASLVLTDRICARVYFDKAYVDDILSQESWTLKYCDVDGTEITADLTEKSILQQEKIELVGSYYALTLPYVAASEFHQSYMVYAENFGTVTFSILDLCKNAVDYDYSGKTGDFAYLAKNIYNLGFDACRAFHGDYCYASECVKYDGVELIDEYLTLSDDTFDTSAIRRGAFKFVAAPLVLESGMGIQFYGRYDGADSISVYVNGEKLSSMFYSWERITPTAENGNSNYRFTLRVKASYLHEGLTVGVRAGSEANYSQIDCSIAAACNQYVPGDRDYELTRSVLSYIESVYHYNNRDTILAERRRIAWEEMYRMMTVIWTPTVDFEYSHNNSYFNSDGEFAGDATTSLRKFKAGTYYSGIPYAHGSASTNAFLATGTGEPNKKGVYTISPTFEMVTGSPSWARLGNDCNDAVFWAWAASTAHCYNTSSAGCVPRNGVIPVGDYELAYKDDGGQFNIDEGVLVTNPTTLYGKTPYIWLYNEAVHGEGTMYEALSKLQPGDGLVYHIVTDVAEDDADETGAAAGHVMMVQDIHVVRKADGTVDPDQSYLLLMDQTSSPMGSGNLADPHSKWQKYWNEELGAYVYQCPNVNRDLNGDGVYTAKVSGNYTDNEALHKRTFKACAPSWKSAKNAYSGGYLPITASDFENAAPLPKLKITDSLAGTEMDFDSIFDGYLVSNYRISHAKFDFYDQNGVLVKSFTAFGKESEFNSNSKHEHLFRFTRLTNERDECRNIYGTTDFYDLYFGSRYTCVVTVQAGTMEDIEVRRFTFTPKHVTESPEIPLG